MRRLRLEEARIRYRTNSTDTALALAKADGLAKAVQIIDRLVDPQFKGEE